MRHNRLRPSFLYPIAVLCLSVTTTVIMMVGFILTLAAAHPIAATGQAGPTVSKLLFPDSDLEVAVAGSVWINAPVSDGVRAMKDIEHLERGNGFQVTKRISNPPRL